MTTTPENKGQSTSVIVLVIFRNNYNDARNNECKMQKKIVVCVGVAGVVPALAAAAATAAASCPF